jgi:hypothetical protein
MLTTINTLTNKEFIINAGTFQLNNKIYMNKNINIYKSPVWLYCNVKIHNVLYKRIYPEELVNEMPYSIEMDKCNDMPSLLFNNAIIYQRDAWFAFSVEFILTEPLSSLENTFYDYNIKDIKNNNNYINTKN